MNRLLFPLLLLQFYEYGVKANDVPSCACALEESDNVLDCSNSDALLEATATLQSNACQLDCTSAVCKSNYYLIQSHHDYCLPSDLPTGLSSAFHTYEETCDDCHVIRRTNPSLPDCPAASCENNSGNAAYAYLLLENCKDHCNTDPACGVNFRTLRSVYDICPDGTVGKVAELGLNDLSSDGACAAQDCNTGDASTDASQLVCDSDSIATRPSRPTVSPTPAPDVVCPDLVQTSAISASVCSACGPNKCVTKPDALFQWTGRPSTKCSALQEAGLGGFLTTEYCEALPDLVNSICACKVAGSYEPYTFPATAPPVPSPRTPASSTAPDSNKGLFMGVIVGVAVGAVVLVAGSFLFCKRRSQQKQATHTAKEDTAEIEIPDMKTSTMMQGLA